MFCLRQQLRFFSNHLKRNHIYIFSFLQTLIIISVSNFSSLESIYSLTTVVRINYCNTRKLLWTGGLCVGNTTNNLDSAYSLLKLTLLLKVCSTLQRHFRIKLNLLAWEFQFILRHSGDNCSAPAMSSFPHLIANDDEPAAK